MGLVHNLMPVAFVFALVTTSGAQQQSVDSGCGANLGNVRESNVTINIDCASTNSHALSFNYSRLFGAMEVPLLMEIVPAGDFEVSDTGYGYRTFSPRQPAQANQSAQGREYPTEMHSRLVRFRSHYPYRNASPLQTPFWTAIAGDYEAAENIAWRATAGRRVDKLCFFASSIIDSSAYNAEVLADWLPNDRYCDPIFASNNNRIGFTFLIIENTSSGAVDDLRLYYRESYSTNPVKDDYDPPERGDNEYKEYLKREIESLPRDGEAVANLVQKYGRSREAEIALADRPQEFMYVARLEPKQKLIALLNIFTSNSENLPATYLYGIYDFEEVSFSIRGASYHSQIRRPSKDRAARVKVPFGWFQQ
jgi:hypothetical protein